VGIDVAAIRAMTREEMGVLLTRIARARSAATGFELELLHLEAECHRHLGNIITADDLYCRAAEQVLSSTEYPRRDRFQKLLIEAATVARQRGSMTQQVSSKIVRYLEILPDHTLAPLRISTMLLEAHARLGEGEKYQDCRAEVEAILREQGETLAPRQRELAEAALARAETLHG